MKPIFKFSPFLLILFLLQISVMQAVAQDNCVCALCDIPCSSPSSSHWHPDCPVVKNRISGSQNASSQFSTKTQSISFEEAIFQQIFTGMVQNAFSGKSDAEKQELLQEEKLRQQRLEAMLKEQKRINDSIVKARHDEMMKDYKPLEGSGDVAYKGLDSKDRFSQNNFNCKITEFKGQIVVMKPNGQKITLTDKSSVDLAPGDWIVSGPDSRIKLHYSFENGGQDFILGQNSGLTLEIDENGLTHPKLVKGRSYEFSNIGQETYAKLNEELLSLEKQFYNEPVLEIKIAVLKKIKSKFQHQLRVPTAICGIRGTEFTASVDSLGNSYVYLMNGAVDIIGNSDDNIVSLTPGNFCEVNSEGKIVRVEKFDIEKFEKWWEE